MSRRSGLSSAGGWVFWPSTPREYMLFSATVTSFSLVLYSFYSMYLKVNFLTADSWIDVLLPFFVGFVLLLVSGLLTFGI